MNVSSCGCRSYRSCTSPCPPPYAELLSRSERLKQVVRITGALSVNITPQPQGGVLLEDALEAAVEILEAVNNPPGQPPRDPPGTLTLVYYPYYWYPPSTYPRPTSHGFPEECEACTPGVPETCPDDPRETCHDGDAVDEYEGQLLAVIDKLNQLGPGVALVGQQFFDTERWRTDPLALGWNDAVTTKHNRFYEKGKEWLQDVPIYQYDRGAVGWVDSPIHHRHNRVAGDSYTLSPDELGNTYGVSLYIVPDLDRMRASLEATVERARENAPPNASELLILPWVGLASGVRDIGEHYDENWDYGTRALRDFTLWLRGYSPPAQSNPTIIVSAIGLFPGPFWRGTPHWCRDFIEYVRAYTQQ